MKKITHWVLGTATARVSGDTARFMNIAVKTGLRPIRLQKDGKDVLFTLYAKDYKKLHKIKQRTHARVKLAEKSGFPFRFRRMLRRPGLLLGTALGVALMRFLSGFYWEMTISGEDIPYAESEILAAAKRVGVYIGAPRSSTRRVAPYSLSCARPSQRRRARSTTARGISSRHARGSSILSRRKTARCS